MGKKKPPKRRRGLVELDPDKLERALLRLGISKTQLADTSDVSRATVAKALEGQGIFASSAKLIAKAMGYDDPAELRRGSSAISASEAETGSEWQVDAYLGPWITASNSLQYRACRMRHQFVEGRLGRGKCYDLLNPSTRSREQLRDCLVRHPTVCSRIGHHRHVADNLATFPDPKNDVWWVVDRWVEGETLEERLARRAMAQQDISRLATEIASGLRALHAANVVFRELAPKRVLIAREDGHAILTDFELAKLLDTGPTVSADWPEDAYRAPEVEGGKVSRKADLYSWAKVVVHTSCGRLPPAAEESAELARVGLPKGVFRLIDRCLSPGPSDRPKDMGEVLRSLRRAWPECF